MAKSAAVRRLELILFDVSPEEYGPKLFRLKKADQDYILGRIERNENAQVTRREILRLDRERLAANRARKQSKKLPTIEELRAKARAKLHSMWKHKQKYVAVNMRRNTKYMTAEDLEYTMNATQSELEDRAHEPATPYPDLDIELNVFWYH